MFLTPFSSLLFIALHFVVIVLYRPVNLSSTKYAYYIFKFLLKIKLNVVHCFSKLIAINTSAVIKRIKVFWYNLSFMTAVFVSRFYSIKIYATKLICTFCYVQRILIDLYNFMLLLVCSWMNEVCIMDRILDKLSSIYYVWQLALASTKEVGSQDALY